MPRAPEELQQDKVLLRFLEEINDDVLRACEENDESDAERFFTDWMLEFWTDTGLIEEGAAVCNYDTRKFKVNGYKPSTDEDSVDLFVSHLVQQTEIQTLTKAQVNSLFTRARDFFEESAATSKRFFERMDGPPEAAAIAEDIFTRRRKIDRVRFLLFTNAVSISTVKDEEQVGNRTFSYEILDLERTLQEHLSRQPITIDFRSEFGESIPCLKAPNMEADYTSCLAMFRGEILYKIYKRYGARLLERNVRSFLQARPKVNKGIRETIVKMPDRFLAYNNGISATAAHIDFYDAPGGSCVINRITDLQIVNGGQTTAMIYQTHKIAPEHVSKIYVPAKITMVKDPALLDSIVPEIARCANSQNKISDSDFLANDAFHTTLQDLSRLTAAKLPGSSQVFYWYYERARGQYAEERSRANRKQFESKYPPENMFTKTDLAKFENSWHQLPHLVSRGAQKNFTEFDRRFVKKQKVTANETYFKELVAKAILFREANTIIKKQQFGGHVNSILTFTIALLCRLLEFDGTVLNLEKIWKQQALSAELKSELEKLSIHVHKAIMESAGNQNVGEWCKKEECWLYIRDLNISKLVLHDTDVVPLPPEELSAPNNEEDTEEADDSVFSQSTI